MNEHTELYDALGVRRDASDDDIRRAYRKLARVYHPDVSKEPEAEAKFKALNQAYEVLRDPEKRRMYDRYGQNGPQSPFGVDLDDFGGFGDVFDTFFGSGRRRGGSAARQGADLRANLEMEFVESVFGVEKRLRYERREPCGTCGGSGAAPGTKPVTCRLCGGTGQVQRAQRSIFGQFVNIATCERCGGTGQEIPDVCPTCRSSGLEQREMDRAIKIPAGLQPGSELRLAGEGDHGPHGGPPGDLYVAITVKPHPSLNRDGDDIVSTMVLNVSEAALGVSLEIETVDGPAQVTIPAGTQPGSVLQLKGKGVPHFSGSGRGDHLVSVYVAVPAKLTREQRALFAQLRDSLPPGSAEAEGGFVDRVRAAFR